MSVAAESIPNLAERYKKRVKPAPVKLPKALRPSFKVTLWFSAAQWVQLMRASADLKTGRLSVHALIFDSLGIEGQRAAREHVPMSDQLAAIRTMRKPPSGKRRAK